MDRSRSTIVVFAALMLGAGAVCAQDADPPTETEPEPEPKPAEPAAAEPAVEHPKAPESDHPLEMTAKKILHLGQELIQAASDPTASLHSLNIADWHDLSYYNVEGDDTANTIVIRPIVPFEALGVNNIFRATVPYVTESPVHSDGLGDITLVDLLIFDEGDWRWGVGPVVKLPTGGDDRGNGQWTLGPALGFSAHDRDFLYGVFNQNYFTVAGDSDRPKDNTSTLQPILNRTINSEWSVGTSQMDFTYDWDKGEWTKVPLGVKFSKLARFGGGHVHFNLEFEHNFADNSVEPENTIRFTVKILFPR